MSKTESKSKTKAEPKIKSTAEKLPSFEAILDRAIKRKGSKKELFKLLDEPRSNQQLAAKPDAYFLSYMARCVFNAGFVWKIVSHKWPNFEKAFLKFDPSLLLRLSDEQWENFASNESIIRHYTKIKSVRENAQFVLDISFEHKSFGKFLAQWPADDQTGLLALLKKRGSRLGGMSGQYFLRYCGKDGFVLGRDVVTCLQGAGIDVPATPTAKRDLLKIQTVFNHWQQETKLNYTQLSQIMAFSVGDNYK